jgi:hypothetical protein
MLDKIIPQDSTLFQPEIKNYIQFLEKERGNLSVKKLMKQPLDSIKEIASLSYQANDKDYIGVHRYLISRKGLVAETFQAIHKMLGGKVTKLIQIGYLLEMKINSINEVSFHSPSGITYPRVEINATILDEIKGNKLKPGDSITFVYNCFLRRTDYNFQKGETIFAGISINDYNNIITNYLFYDESNESVKDGSYGRFPIKNGILIDRNNAWGYGKSVPWEEFKMKLAQDINNIITGR